MSFDPSQCLLASLLLNQSLWQLPGYTALCQLLASVSMLWLWGFAQHYCARGQQVPSAWAALLAWLASATSSSRGSSSRGGGGGGAYGASLDRPGPGAATKRVSAPPLASGCRPGLRPQATSSPQLGRAGALASMQPLKRHAPILAAPQVDGVLVVDVDRISSSGIYGQEASFGERLQQLLDALYSALVAPLQGAWRALSSRLSPPALGALLGAAAGLVLCCRPAWFERAPGAPWETGVLLGAGAAAWQLAAALGGAAAVVQQLLVVLPLAATSLAGQAPGVDDEGEEEEEGSEQGGAEVLEATIDVERTDAGAGVAAQQERQEGRRRQEGHVRLRGVWSPDALVPLLLPQGAAERQCLGAAACIRYLLLPGLALACALLLARLGVAGLHESVVLKACVLLPVMPPAVSMVVLLVQREGADVFTAARAARLVLQMQLLALLASPVWLLVLGRARGLLL